MQGRRPLEATGCLSGPSKASCRGFAFPAGSMDPKISAAIEFVQATGNPSAIGRLEDVVEIVKGRQGTWFEA